MHFNFIYEHFHDLIILQFGTKHLASDLLCFIPDNKRTVRMFRGETSVFEGKIGLKLGTSVTRVPWLGDRDLNPDYILQRDVSYH